MIGSKNLSYGDNTLNNKNYQSSERKKNGSHKPYDLIPQLNKGKTL